MHQFQIFNRIFSFYNYYLRLFWSLIRSDTYGIIFSIVYLKSEGIFISILPLDMIGIV
jgi:hypothetical protein